MTPKQVHLLHLCPGRRALFSLVAGILLIGSLQLRAVGLRFDTFIGFDNMVPAEGWFPVTCEIQNDGPSFVGIVEVSAEGMGRGQTRRLRVDLPTGTLKRVVIPVFTASQIWNIRLVDEKSGKVRDEKTQQQSRVAPRDMPLLAGLSRTVTGLPVFPEAPPGGLMNYRPVRLQAETFPDNPLSMESVDVIYLNSTKALELKDMQAQAVRAWLQSGGHLVIGVEQISDITGNKWLNELMPCEFTDTRSLADHAQLQQWIRAPWNTSKFQQHNYTYTPGMPPQMAMRGGRAMMVPGRGNNSANPEDAATSPLAAADDSTFESTALPIVTGTMRDGAVLIGDPSAPLAITAERGRGQITVLAFSPEREPFVSWKNRGWFWAKMADVPLARLEATQNQNGYNPGRMSSDGIFGSMIDSKQVRKLPLPWLLALLVAYLVVIGPLDQYILKKINRQMLTWITFPLYVAGFSGLIYLIGFHLRAGELEWNELDVVDILPDLSPNQPSPLMRGETYVSIYSPVNARYQIGSTQPFATLRGEYGGDYGGGAEANSADILQEGNYFDAEATVPVWTSQLYVADWLQRAEPVPLAMSVSRQGSAWSVTIENKTDQNLTPVRVVLGERIFDVPALPPHLAKSLTFNVSDGMPMANYANQYGAQFSQAVGNRHASFGNNAVAITDVADGAMAESFLSKMDQGGQGDWNTFRVFRNRDLGQFVGSDHAILLAWEPNHTEVQNLNRFTAKRLHRSTLLRLVVPVKNQ